MCYTDFHDSHQRLITAFAGEYSVYIFENKLYI